MRKPLAGSAAAVLLALVPTFAVEAAPAMAAGRSPSALASAITDKPLAKAVVATRQALAKGGIPVREGRRVFARANAPAPISFTRMEVLHLALEAHGGGTSMSLAELGTRLKHMGFPFPRRANPGGQLAAFLKDWVRRAGKRPRVAANFTPLFLAAMAKRRIPAIDLAGGGYDPEHYRLSLMEIDLFAAAFNRGQPQPRPHRAHRRAGRHASAAAPTPCSTFMKAIKLRLGEITIQPQQYIKDGVGKGLQQALSNLFNRAGVKLGPSDVAEILKWTQLAMIADRLIAFYGKATIRAHAADDEVVHKPLERPNVASNKPERFFAVAGVNEKDWQEYERIYSKLGPLRGIAEAARDCLRAFELPVPTNEADLADELKNWHVEWKAELYPYDARVDDAASQFDGGFRRHKLHPLGAVSAYEGATKPVVVDVLPERVEDHHWGTKVFDTCVSFDPCGSSDVLMTASLRADKPPDLKTFVRGVTGPLGLARSIAELLAGWIQATFRPSDTAEMTITFHSCGGGHPMQAAQVSNLCGPPAAYRVNLSGTFDNSGGGGGGTDKETWSGTAVYEREGDASSTQFLPKRGSVHWQMAGTLGECTVTGSQDFLIEGDSYDLGGPRTAGGVLYVYADRLTYTGNGSWQKRVPTQVSCPDGSGYELPWPPYHKWLDMGIAKGVEHPFQPDQSTYTGSYSDTDENGSEHWDWALTPCASAASC
jgi:hypothetical protein